MTVSSYTAMHLEKAAHYNVKVAAWAPPIISDALLIHLLAVLGFLLLTLILVVHILVIVLVPDAFVPDIDVSVCLRHLQKLYTWWLPKFQYQAGPFYRAFSAVVTLCLVCLGDVLAAMM